MRVLVADDDLVSRLAMVDVLEQCGPMRATLVEDGAAAWDRLNGEEFFDLVCLDVRMPAPDGLQIVALARASAALRRVPLMLITATTDRGTVLSANRHELQGFIVKPVGSDTAERIRRVLAQLDASILEPAGIAMARLKIDLERHVRYVAAFRQQVAALRAQAAGLEELSAPTDALAAFARKCEACRAAALTLGAPRIEQVIGDAQAVAAEDATLTTRALGLASYWLERVQALGGLALDVRPGRGGFGGDEPDLGTGRNG